MIYAFIALACVMVLAVCIQLLLPDDDRACHENCDQGRMCTCRNKP